MNVKDATHRLDSIGIAHSAFQADSGKMRAIVRSVKKDMIIQTDAAFELIFDSEGKVARITGRRVYTGP